MHFWFLFYAAAVLLTLAHALIPLVPGWGRQHVLGAEILALSWLSAFGARLILHDATPLVANSAIDVTVAGAFLYITLKHKAIWSGICVILHFFMILAHAAHYVNPLITDNAYIWALNSLFFLSLLSVNVAIEAGRREWGDVLDRFIIHYARGWTFSGLRFPRIHSYCK